MSQLTLREGELDRIIKKFPDRIPIIVTRSTSEKNTTPDIRKQKFLVPRQFTAAELVITVRRWLLLKPEQAIFLFIDNHMPTIGCTLGELYERHKGADGVLRIVYATENTFGYD